MLVYVHELSNMNLIECRLPGVDKQVNNKYETVNKRARQGCPPPPGCPWNCVLLAHVYPFFNDSFIGLSRSRAATSVQKLPSYVRLETTASPNSEAR